MWYFSWILGVGLAVIEATAWIIHPPPRSYSIPRDMLTQASGVWTLTPDFRGVMDNRIDFRGETVNADSRGVRRGPAAVGTPVYRRLFVLGDSQTFGHGLNDDETWPARLQGLLDIERPGTQVENWGVPGINVDQYAERLKRLLVAAKAGDAVLVGVSWNDLITPQTRQAMSIVEGYLVNAPAKPQEPAFPAEQVPTTVPTGAATDPATAARVRLYDYTGVVIPPFQDLQQFAEALALNSALASFLVPRLRALWHRWRPKTPFPELLAAQVPDANFWLLFNMKEEAKARGIAFAVVLLPERYFIDDAMYHAYSGGGRFFPERNYMGYIAQPLCRSFDISCIDPFEALVEHHRREPVTFHVDGHYNPAGAAVVAAVLARELKSFLP